MIFDIIVLAVLLVSALHAFWRGFIREVLTIFGAIGGVFAALAFGAGLRPIMDGWLGIVQGEKVAKLFDVIPMTLVSTVLSYALIFILVFGVLSFISHLISEQVRSLGLGAVDRTLGVVFGLARGFVILGIFYLPIHLFMDDSNKESWFQESKTQVVVAGVSEVIKNMMPGSLFANQTAKASDDPTKAKVTDVLKQINDVVKPVAPSGEAVPAAGPGAGAGKNSGYDAAARAGMEKLIDGEKVPAKP